jgi:hypothetical protein
VRFQPPAAAEDSPEPIVRALSAAARCAAKTTPCHRRPAVAILPERPAVGELRRRQSSVGGESFGHCDQRTRGYQFTGIEPVSYLYLRDRNNGRGSSLEVGAQSIAAIAASPAAARSPT